MYGLADNKIHFLLLLEEGDLAFPLMEDGWFLSTPITIVKFSKNNYPQNYKLVYHQPIHQLYNS